MDFRSQWDSAAHSYLNIYGPLNGVSMRAAPHAHPVGQYNYGRQSYVGRLTVHSLQADPEHIRDPPTPILQWGHQQPMGVGQCPSQPRTLSTVLSTWDTHQPCIHCLLTLQNVEEQGFSLHIKTHVKYWVFEMVKIIGTNLVKGKENLT